jgi:ADP-heptose:LPS heptosyltransferase
MIIFRIGSIGDTVVALPCFHHIARTFPNSRRLVITDVPVSQKASSVESVIGKTGLIDGVIYFPAPPRKIRDFLELRTQIQETEPRLLIYIADRGLPKTLRDICFFRTCGIRRVIGAPLTRGLRVPRLDPFTGYVEREAVRLTRCLAPLGKIDLDDPGVWDLCLQPEEIAFADKNLTPIAGRGIVAISIGGKVESKDWGNENWATLLRLMAAQYSSLALLLVGSADESDRSAKIAAAWPGHALNLCGRLTPRESAAAIKRALLFIGHDSGPMHLAAVTGVPCVGLFGNFNVPKVWHPMGKNHHVIHNMNGIRAISPGQVYAAVCSTIAAAQQFNKNPLTPSEHDLLAAK